MVMGECKDQDVALMNALHTGHVGWILGINTDPKPNLWVECQTHS